MYLDRQVTSKYYVNELQLNRIILPHLQKQQEYLNKHLRYLYDHPNLVLSNLNYISIKEIWESLEDFWDNMWVYEMVYAMSDEVEKVAIKWYKERYMQQIKLMLEHRIPEDLNIPYEIAKSREELHLSNYKWSISRTTKLKILEILKEWIQTWASYNEVAQKIKLLDPILFWEYRSKMIAVNEAAKVYEAGNYAPMKSLSDVWERVMKKRMTVWDERVSKEICLANELEGWIELSSFFQSWHDIPTGHVNCYDKQTKVLTKEWLKFISEIIEWDYCVTINPKTQNISYEKVIWTTKQFKEKIYSFQTNDFSLMVSEDHRILYQKSRDRFMNRKEYQFIEAKLLPNYWRIPRIWEWIGNNDKYFKVWNVKINFDKYCKLMWRYLSEWSTTYRKEKDIYQIKISQSKYKDILRNDLNETWLERYEWKEYFGINNKDLGKYLIKFKKSYEKYIPNDIKNSSIENIKSFLETFNLGDWSIENQENEKIKSKKRKKYFTSSKQLKDDLCELILKIWKRPSIYIMESKWKNIQFRNWEYTINHNIYVITENNWKYTDLSNLKRELIEYNDYVYWIEVENNKTLYVERNWKFCWSWNCRCTTWYKVIRNR